MKNFLLDETEKEQQQQWLLDHLKIIPSSIDVSPTLYLSKLIKLDLPNMGLTELPCCLPTICPSLEILFCPKNNFSEVPEVIGKCPNLQMVSFKESHTIEYIHPEALQPQLRWLILTGNRITSIPDTIGRCTKLQKCMLSGNLLEALPSAEIWSNLKNLELIRLACNRLQEPPLDLLRSCPNLKWAAFAGNPFLESLITEEESSSSSSSLPLLDDPVLDEDHWPVLGRGAGGVTRKVTWKGRDVAVKTFGGALTSDGSPEDEKAISKLVVSTQRNHAQEPSLIELLGETSNGALVMEFLEGYRALAGPPSFATCSRDVYDDGIPEGFPLWKIATDTLRVVARLHQRGVSHSDLYAHNILIQPETHAIKVSDFGAAFRYGTSSDNSEFGRLVETVELRAFAVLVEELFAYAQQQVEPQNHPWEEFLRECQAPGATFRKLADQFRS